jgi:hypothetical protein
MAFPVIALPVIALPVIALPVIALPVIALPVIALPVMGGAPPSRSARIVRRQRLSEEQSFSDRPANLASRAGTVGAPLPPPLVLIVCIWVSVPVSAR